MLIGTRVLYPEEVDLWNADILQISVYEGMKDNLQFMRKCSAVCRDTGTGFVIHPVKYSLLDNRTYDDIREMAQLADKALIIHDERMPDGSRLEGEYRMRFSRALEDLKSLAPVSVENASNTGDVQWFWNTFADSITLDIGHVESFGLNSVDFVRSLDRESIEKIHFVHMHRNNGLRGGITDHWPLTPDCREIQALKELVRRRPDVSVILEINEVEEIDASLSLLRSVRDSFAA